MKRLRRTWALAAEGGRGCLPTPELGPALAPRGVGLAAGRRGAPAPRAGAALCPVGADGLGAAGLCLDVRRLALAGSGRLPCLACRRLGGGRIAGVRGGGGGVRPGGALRCGEERCRTARGRLERRDSRCAALVGRVLSGGALPHADAGTDGLGDGNLLLRRVVPLGGPGASDGGHGLGGAGAVSSAGRCAGQLAFVAVALDVQHQSGGSLAAVLDAARESVESEIDLARSLKEQTAQAQLSARIVTAMPFVLIALFSLMSPGSLSPFFESMAGMALLGGGSGHAGGRRRLGASDAGRGREAVVMDVSWAQGAAAVVAVGSAALLGGMASRIVGAWRRRIRHRAAVVGEGSVRAPGRPCRSGRGRRSGCADSRLCGGAVPAGPKSAVPLPVAVVSTGKPGPSPERRSARQPVLAARCRLAGYGEVRECA